MNNNENRNNGISLWTIKWFVGALFIILLSIATFGAGVIEHRMDRMEEKADRIMMYEAHLESINFRLCRIENILDDVMKGKRRIE